MLFPNQTDTIGQHKERNSKPEVQAYPVDKQSTSKPIKGKEMVKIRFSGKSDPKYADL